MPRYILKEGIIMNVVKFIFQMVADGKTAALQKKFAKDPDMIEYIKQTDAAAKAIGEHLQNMKDSTINDPEWVGDSGYGKNFKI